MNIILDIDYTLIDSHGYDLTERPYLEEFLYYLFSRFKNVSIWTAGSVEWFDYVNKKIFSKYLKDEKFHHVWTFDNCKIVYGSYGSQEIIKPLNSIYDNEYNNFNTIIIDDTEFTFSENILNAINIKKFFLENDKDDELMGIIPLIENKIIELK